MQELKHYNNETNTNRESTVNNGIKLIYFCVFSNITTMNSFLKHKTLTNLHGVLLQQNQYEKLQN
jgi:hypothetical protein